jgi:hypothetical protein
VGALTGDEHLPSSSESAEHHQHTTGDLDDDGPPCVDRLDPGDGVQVRAVAEVAVEHDSRQPVAEEHDDDAEGGGRHEDEGGPGTRPPADRMSPWTGCRWERRQAPHLMIRRRRPYGHGARHSTRTSFATDGTPVWSTRKSM